MNAVHAKSRHGAVDGRVVGGEVDVRQVLGRNAPAACFPIKWIEGGALALSANDRVLRFEVAVNQRARHLLAPALYLVPARLQQFALRHDCPKYCRIRCREHESLQTLGESEARGLQLFQVVTGSAIRKASIGKDLGCRNMKEP